MKYASSMSASRRMFEANVGVVEVVEGGHEVMQSEGVATRRGVRSRSHRWVNIPKGAHGWSSTKSYNFEIIVKDQEDNLCGRSLTLRPNARSFPHTTISIAWHVVVVSVSQNR